LEICSLADQAQEAGIAQTVVNIAPLPACDQDARLTKRHEVLGQVRLPPTKGRFEVADAGIAISDRQQDLKASRGPDGLEKV